MLAALAAGLAGLACGGGAAAAAGGSGTPPPPPAPDRLTFRGSTMLGPDGKPLLLRGINEGTWGEMRSGDAAWIQGQGANVVRVLLRWWGLYGTPDIDSRSDGSLGHIDTGHLGQFLKEVQWCLDAGLWVVPAIDSNCGQNGLQNAEMARYCDPTGSFPGGHNFWTDPAMRQKFKEAWVYVAAILKGYPRIAFYELLPEPLSGRGADVAATVSAFYQELMAAISDQAGDTRTPFLVGPRDAYDISLCDEAYIADPRWANRVVYTGNLFIHPTRTQAENLSILEERLGALARMKAARNVPVFIQQYGVRTGDDPTGFYLDAGLSRMNAAAIGYTGWQWRQNTPNPDEYAVVLTDPATGKDKVKQLVLDLYARYWRA